MMYSTAIKSLRNARLLLLEFVWQCRMHTLIVAAHSDQALPLNLFPIDNAKRRMAKAWLLDFCVLGYCF